MFVIDLPMPCFLVDCLVGLGKGWIPKIYFFTKFIVKLYVISDDGRQATIAELRRNDELEDEVKDDVMSFRGGFEETVTIWMVGDKDMSLGVGLERGCNGMKGEIEKVMLEGLYDNELSVGVLDKTIGVGDHKQCKICNQSS